MTKRRLVTLSGLLSATMSFSSFAQTSTAQRASPQPPRPTVTLGFVVTRNGEPVSGMTKDQFGLLDEGQAPGPVAFREASSDTEPVRAVIVIDAFNINAHGEQVERDQVDRFLAKKIVVPTALALLTNRGLTIQHSFSTDGPGMAAQLRGQAPSTHAFAPSLGSTGANIRLDASIHGLTQVLDRVKGLPGHTLILWVSPGWPLLSGPRVQLSDRQQRDIFDEAVRLSTLMREARATLYAINPLGVGESLVAASQFEPYLAPITNPRKSQLGSLALPVLAIQSGGLALNSSDVAKLLDKCLADRDGYYELTFPMAQVSQPDAFRSIFLKGLNPNLQVRTRNGYYAEP